VLLAGGVGGAKMASGLAATPDVDLTVLVNTADDTEFHGLLVMPDHDTVMYTLAGIADPVQGWGIAGETYVTLEALERLGADTWFRIGDRDLATHLVRTSRLAAGERLTDVCRALQAAHGVERPVLPMSDDPVRTHVRTSDGWLAFQDWFVRLHQEPAVTEVRFEGAAAAAPTPEVVAAISEAEAIVVAPSNPLVSIGPILAIDGIRTAIDAARRRNVPVVGVSPIVGGRALRGPADRMLVDAGHEASALGVARLQGGLLDGFVIDAVDRALEPAIAALGIRTLVTDTVMVDAAARVRLGAEVASFAASMAG
jgi:LPPG:FO 2-phospho-L-lactate transferase